MESDEEDELDDEDQDDDEEDEDEDDPANPEDAWAVTLKKLIKSQGGSVAVDSLAPFPSPIFLPICFAGTFVRTLNETR